MLDTDSEWPGGIPHIGSAAAPVPRELGPAIQWLRIEDTPTDRIRP